MLRLIAITLFLACLSFTTTGCGRSGETTVIQPETTQTEADLDAIHEESEAAMETSNLAE